MICFIVDQFLLIVAGAKGVCLGDTTMHAVLLEQAAIFVTRQTLPGVVVLNLTVMLFVPAPLTMVAFEGTLHT